jgi:hypothetical protein
MENYNFWKEFFDTYRSSSDLIKALWILVPPLSLLGLTWIALNAPYFRPRIGRAPQTAPIALLPVAADFGLNSVGGAPHLPAGINFNTPAIPPELKGG